MAAWTAHAAALAAVAPEVASWVPVALLVVIAIVFGAGTLLASAVLGKSRTGPIKDSPYESGVEPVGLARRRFNIRFYIVALEFLLFDVEVVMLFPWAVSFGGSSTLRTAIELAGGLVFIAVLVVGLIYGWRRGTFQFS